MERKRITLEQWIALLKQQNKPTVELLFRCPKCGTVQCGNDLIAAGAGANLEEIESYLAYSCVGRWDQTKGCDWTLGGLFQIHTLEVMLPDGTVHPRFEPVQPSEPEAAHGAPLGTTPVDGEEKIDRTATGGYRLQHHHDSEWVGIAELYFDPDEQMWFLSSTNAALQVRHVICTGDDDEAKALDMLWENRSVFWDVSRSNPNYRETFILRNTE